MKVLTWIIAAVAVYDIYCTVKMQDSILHCEENLFAKQLIYTKWVTLFTENPLMPNEQVSVSFKTCDVSLLVAVKSAGLVVAFMFMFYLSDNHPKIASAAILPVFIGSLWLLFKLAH